MEQAAILIADDNPEIREIIQILLSGEGFQVHEAASGTQALGMLKENTFDLIILDIMMPGLNGYQTCLEIRKSTNVPILFLSARTQESDKTLGFSSGGDELPCKTFFLRRTGEPRQGTDPQIPDLSGKTGPAGTAFQNHISSAYTG